MNNRRNGARLLAALLALLILTGCGAAAVPGPEQSSPAVPGEPEPAGSAVEVSTVDEFLAALASDQTISLAAGTYDLSTASDYGKDTGTAPYYWVPVYDDNRNDSFELVISGLQNLRLTGAGTDAVTIAAVPRYANVLHFENCGGLKLTGLTAGHTTLPGYCAGGVLFFDSCSDIVVDGCGLFGCGTVGVDAENCTNVSVTHSSIYECSNYAVFSHACRNVNVDGCEIHHNGTKAELGNALSVIHVSSSDGFAVRGNYLHDNSCQYFLPASYTKNCVFLSNRVEKNTIMTAAFHLEQYSPVVDGCSFESNFFYGYLENWYDGNTRYAVDSEGNTLGADALRNMEYREIDPASVTASVPTPMPTVSAADGEIHVSTVDEFLAAIGPNRTIVLDAPLYDLSTASNYGSIGTAYYYWNENYDGPELVISGVDNLTIRTAGGPAEDCVIAAIPRYANVLYFRNCSGISLAGFTAGHTQEPGTCAGGVLYFEDCHDMYVEGCDLYGCGILGIQTWQGTGLTVRDCEIYDCSWGAVSCSMTDGIRFLNCDIHDVASPALFFSECGDLLWNDEPLENTSYNIGADGVPVYWHYDDSEENPVQYDQPAFELSQTDRDFLADVQKDFADRNWESLADRLHYPVSFSTSSGTVYADSREDFLAMDPDSRFTDYVLNSIAFGRADYLPWSGACGYVFNGSFGFNRYESSAYSAAASADGIPLINCFFLT